MPGVEELAKKYNIIELNTAVKPAIFTFLFEKHKSDHVIYLDPDVRFMMGFRKVELLFQREDSILLSPRIFVLQSMMVKFLRKYISPITGFIT